MKTADEILSWNIEKQNIWDFSSVFNSQQISIPAGNELLYSNQSIN